MLNQAIEEINPRKDMNTLPEKKIFSKREVELIEKACSIKSTSEITTSFEMICFLWNALGGGKELKELKEEYVKSENKDAVETGVKYVSACITRFYGKRTKTLLKKIAKITDESILSDLFDMILDSAPLSTVKAKVDEILRTNPNATKPLP